MSSNRSLRERQNSAPEYENETRFAWAAVGDDDSSDDEAATRNGTTVHSTTFCPTWVAAVTASNRSPACLRPRRHQSSSLQKNYADDNDVSSADDPDEPYEEDNEDNQLQKGEQRKRKNPPLTGSNERDSLNKISSRGIMLLSNHHPDRNSTTRKRKTLDPSSVLNNNVRSDKKMKRAHRRKTPEQPTKTVSRRPRRLRDSPRKNYADDDQVSSDGEDAKDESYRTTTTTNHVRKEKGRRATATTCASSTTPHSSPQKDFQIGQEVCKQFADGWYDGMVTEVLSPKRRGQHRLFLVEYENGETEHLTVGALRQVLPTPLNQTRAFRRRLSIEQQQKSIDRNSGKDKNVAWNRPTVAPSPLQQKKLDDFVKQSSSSDTKPKELKQSSISSFVNKNSYRKPQPPSSSTQLPRKNNKEQDPKRTKTTRKSTTLVKQTTKESSRQRSRATPVREDHNSVQKPTNDTSIGRRTSIANLENGNENRHIDTACVVTSKRQLFAESSSSESLKVSSMEKMADWNTGDSPDVQSNSSARRTTKLKASPTARVSVADEPAACPLVVSSFAALKSEEADQPCRQEETKKRYHLVKTAETATRVVSSPEQVVSHRRHGLVRLIAMKSVQTDQGEYS